MTSVPSLLVGKDIEGVFSQLAKSNKEGIQLGATEEIMHDLLSTMACHAAVRSGEELPDAELEYLMKEAEQLISTTTARTVVVYSSGGKSLKLNLGLIGRACQNY